MFLKKIKINGFKSFARPVVIDFESPLTAIVGPNGSGKSNIVDAIRWALGEQSAKTLRGSRMADVIFAGSDSHKPLKEASVTLYLNNENHILPIDTKEVRISRCVSADGQSDYLINGSICRLKDIEELLLDTGMTREAYSIVGQGKIETILNSKPEKLRELFEEAAGISKYKIRKEEAETRLTKTNQDLQRIDDLIWELEKQVKPLKKAAEKTKKYNRLQEELTTIESSLLLNNWDKNNERILGLRTKEETYENRLNILRMQSNNNQTDLKINKEKLNLEQEKLQKLQEDYYQAKTKRGEADNKLKVLTERGESLNREYKSKQEYRQGLIQSQEEYHKNSDNIKDRLSKVIYKEDNVKQNLENKAELLNDIKKLLTDKKTELFSLRDTILNDNVVFKDITSEIEKAKEQGHYLEIEIDKMLTKRKELTFELDNNIKEQEIINNKLTQVNQDQQAVKDKLVELTQQKDILSQNLRKHEEEFTEQKNQLNQKRSRLKVLTEMEEEYEGYYRGVRNIMTIKTNFKGLLGVVTDLFQVEEKYELAIETALGSRLQNIIVEDDETARSGVEYLRKTGGGRATFLPLNMIQGHKAHINDNIKEMTGFLGLAVDYVNYQKDLQIAADYLLGRTILVDELKNATKIAKQIQSKYKIVTLSGDVINPGGAITGGSQQNNQGLLARARQQKNLKAEIAQLTKEVEINQKKELKLREELEDLKQIEDELEKEKTDLHFAKSDLSKDLDNLIKIQWKLEKEINEFDQDFIEYHDKLGKIDHRKQELQQKLDLINNDYAREREKIVLLENEIEKKEQQEAELNQEFTDLKVEIATIQQQKNNLSNEKGNIKQQLDNIAKEIEKTNHDCDIIKAELVKLDKEKNELNNLKKEFSLQATELNQRYQQKNNEIKLLTKRVNEFDERQQKLQQELNELTEKYHKLELNITRMEDKNDQIKERLLEEYQIVPGQEKTKIEIDNFSRAASKVKEFKEAIKRLGVINQGAVSELNELKERLGYLKNQQQDLLTARESITKVIKEIEDNMGKEFFKSFNEVKSYFTDIFKDLFHGGQAELNLTDTEDLLNTGVEIVAQPPGKKLKKLSLMSGGERALTAIALVFAFLKENPSPIYILDEIDAPLDDANVLRFAQFIKTYSDYVQFLLITHNKNMMAETNTIYGITMEESGISKIVSLRLDEEIA